LISDTDAFGMSSATVQEVSDKFDSYTNFISALNSGEISIETYTQGLQTDSGKQSLYDYISGGGM